MMSAPNVNAAMTRAVEPAEQTQQDRTAFVKVIAGELAARLSGFYEIDVDCIEPTTSLKPESLLRLAHDDGVSYDALKTHIPDLLRPALRKEAQAIQHTLPHWQIPEGPKLVNVN